MQSSRSPGWKANSVSNNTELSKMRGLIEWWRSTGESWRALVSMIDCSVLQGTSLLSGSTQPSEWKGDVQKSNLGTCTKGPVLQFRRFFLSSCTLIFLEILLWPNFTNFHSDFSLPHPSCFCEGAVTLSPYKALIPSCGLLSRNVIQPFPEAFCFVCFSLLDLLWTFGGDKKKKGSKVKRDSPALWATEAAEWWRLLGTAWGRWTQPRAGWAQLEGSQADLAMPPDQRVDLGQIKNRKMEHFSFPKTTFLSQEFCISWQVLKARILILTKITIFHIYRSETLISAIKLREPC